MKKMIFVILGTLFAFTACTTSVGVGTGFHIGGLGVGLSTSTPLKKAKVKTVEEQAMEKIAETEKQEKIQ